MSLTRVALSASGRLLGRSGTRQMSLASPPNPGYAKTAPIKEFFGHEDSIPVFAKRGFSDRLIYGFSMIVCLTSVGFCFKTYGSLAFK